MVPQTLKKYKLLEQIIYFVDKMSIFDTGKWRKLILSNQKR